ncbi:MAG TPA: tagaturonate epimerase family protein [Bacteroidales bacterium]|nr:tagaturonate epimerase family protein [Bacteroidales bacterium]HPQ62757.1 tagaturonate epimerase family protein [Bacteroidales bacterium]
MIKMKEPGKYSFGTGDRFSHQGRAQLEALMQASSELGIEVTPVWNKSNREHLIVHSEPADVRAEADAAVKALNYTGPYFVDADHINLTTVDRFIEHSDFFTLDVADYIGRKASDTDIEGFVEAHRPFCGRLQIPGIGGSYTITKQYLREFAEKFLFAINEAAAIYRRIVSAKGEGTFVTEVSMDEVDQPQTPLDLLFILKGLADLEVPVQTIAPKFTGRFNKGVDYEGEPDRFAREFEEDILVIKYAIIQFNLPAGLKLSVHSGSDKFSIYPVIGNLIRKHDCGLHLKTAGTTWLEEVIGLALSGGRGLEIARIIYRRAYDRREELCGPYANVIDIRPEMLPSPDEVDTWDTLKFAATLRHVPGDPDYNPSFRQLIHVGYKVAAELGQEYTDQLKENEQVISTCVWENIYRRHIVRLFTTI